MSEDLLTQFQYLQAGYTESLNGLMKILSREGRGFSFEVIRAKVLLTNGLRKQDRPRYDKQKMAMPEHISPPQTDSSGAMPLLH